MTETKVESEPIEPRRWPVNPLALELFSALVFLWVLQYFFGAAVVNVKTTQPGIIPIREFTAVVAARGDFAIYTGISSTPEPTAPLGADGWSFHAGKAAEFAPRKSANPTDVRTYYPVGQHWLPDPQGFKIPFVVLPAVAGVLAAGSAYRRLRARARDRRNAAGIASEGK